MLLVINLLFLAGQSTGPYIVVCIWDHSFVAYRYVTILTHFVLFVNVCR